MFSLSCPIFRALFISGWFFYVGLLTKCKNERKQCQKEQTKGHNILKIKMIFHRHHPHSIKMRGQPTLQHGCHVVFYHIFLCSTIFYFLCVFPITRRTSEVFSQWMLLLPVTSFMNPSLRYMKYPSSFE